VVVVGGWGQFALPPVLARPGPLPDAFEHCGPVVDRAVVDVAKSRPLPLFPWPHEPADGTENAAHEAWTARGCGRGRSNDASADPKTDRQSQFKDPVWRCEIRKQVP
jgi:hypothetical protein